MNIHVNIEGLNFRPQTSVVSTFVERNVPFVQINKSTGVVQTLFIPDRGIVIHRNQGCFNADYVNLTKEEFLNHVKLAMVGRSFLFTEISQETLNMYMSKIEAGQLKSLNPPSGHF